MGWSQSGNCFLLSEEAGAARRDRESIKRMRAFSSSSSSILWFFLRDPKEAQVGASLLQRRGRGELSSWEAPILAREAASLTADHNVG